MTSEEALVELTEVFREVFERPDLTLTRDSRAENVPGWDSVMHINVIVATEMHFGIKFKAAELDEMRDVGELVDVIMKKTKK